MIEGMAFLRYNINIAMSTWNGVRTVLDKAIQYGKEHRKPYKSAKQVSCSCRNNGGCPRCEGNRTYKNRKRLQSAYAKKIEENGGDVA